MNKTELVAEIAAAPTWPRRTSSRPQVLRGRVPTVVAKGEEKLTIPGFLTIEQRHPQRPYGPQPADGRADQGAGHQDRQDHRRLHAQGGGQGRQVAIPGPGRAPCRQVSSGDAGARRALPSCALAARRELGSAP